MTLYEFNLLPYDRQLVLIFDEAIFLARRWEEEDGVNLYHVEGPEGGFFVELYYDTHANEIVRLRSFKSSTPLENYAAYVLLPEL